MALDPNIAMGYRGVELANPLAQYGQIAQIQNAQQANQLNALKMQEAQATMEERNALRQLNPTSADYESQLFKLNPQLGIAFRKEASAAAASKAQQLSHQTTAARTKQEIIGQAFRDFSSRPDNENVISHMRDILESPLFDANEKAAVQARTDQILKMPFEERQSFLAQQGAKAGELKPHFVTENLGGTSRVSAIPAFGGAPSTVSQSPIVMSEAQIAQNKIAQRNADIAAGRLAVEQKRLAQDATGVVYQEDGNGNIVALPSKLKAGEVPTGRMAVAPGGGFQPMQAKPSEAVGKEQMSINQQKSTVQGALDAVKATPDAFGWTTGNLPESVRSRLATSPENETRAFVFNVVSGVIKERAGTAQSAGESATLARFLPADGDNAKVIEDKLTGFQKYLNAKESGTTKKRGGAAATPAATSYSNMSNEDLLKALEGK